MAQRLVLPRRPVISIAILVIGGLAYFALCLPAIDARHRAWIDPIWWGMPYLWVVPLCLSSLFDSWRFGSRRWHLFVYAVVTALIDSATFKLVVPSPVEANILMMFWFLGPLHLIIAACVEGGMQLLLGRTQTFEETKGGPFTKFQMPLFSWLVGFTILCVAIGFPFSFRMLVVGDQQRRGRAAAEDDWANHKAAIYRDRTGYFERNGADITYDFDRETGLECRFCFPPRILGAFSNAYNRRIQELLAEHGDPPWSLKGRIPTPEELCALLTSNDLTEIKEFPHEVTPSIIVFRKGTITRWGRYLMVNSDDLSIATEHGGHIGLAGGVQPVFIGRHNSDPDLIVIRNGYSWVGVIHRDGRNVASASK